MKNKITYLPIGILTLATALGGVTLINSGASATSSNATVTVSISCAFTTSGNSANISGEAGRLYNTQNETWPASSVTCTDPSGFVIQARGEGGDTTLSNAAGTNTIATGTATSGNTSAWGFRITSTSGNIESAYGPVASSYYAVPATATRIISFAGSSSAAVVGTFRPDYQVYVAPTQAADTYTGGVEYTVVPNS